MNVFEDDRLSGRLMQAFPQGFVNGKFEFIAHRKRNSYFLLKGVETEQQLQAKVLEWLSREAIKGGSATERQYHLSGINAFLGTQFDTRAMEDIYTYLGNACNHQKTLRFIESGYDMAVLHLGAEDTLRKGDKI